MQGLQEVTNRFVADMVPLLQRRLKEEVERRLGKPSKLRKCAKKPAVEVKQRGAFWLATLPDGRQFVRKRRRDTVRAVRIAGFTVVTA